MRNPDMTVKLKESGKNYAIKITYTKQRLNFAFYRNNNNKNICLLKEKDETTGKMDKID